MNEKTGDKWVLGYGAWGQGKRNPTVWTPTCPSFKQKCTQSLLARNLSQRRMLWYAALTTLKWITTCSTLGGGETVKRHWKKWHDTTNRSYCVYQPSHCVIGCNIESELARIGVNGGGHKDPESVGFTRELVKKLTTRWICSEFARNWKNAQECCTPWWLIKDLYLKSVRTCKLWD